MNGWDDVLNFMLVRLCHICCFMLLLLCYLCARMRGYAGDSMKRIIMHYDALNTTCTIHIAVSHRNAGCANEKPDYEFALGHEAEMFASDKM